MDVPAFYRYNCPYWHCGALGKSLEDAVSKSRTRPCAGYRARDTESYVRSRGLGQGNF